MVGNQVTDLDALIQEAREWDLRRGSFLIVGKLADALETLRAERDAALAREAALTEALKQIAFYPFTAASSDYADQRGMKGIAEAALASSPPAAEPETSDDPLMVIADHMCDSSARSEPEAVENG